MINIIRKIFIGVAILSCFSILTTVILAIWRDVILFNHHEQLLGTSLTFLVFSVLSVMTCDLNLKK